MFGSYEFITDCCQFDDHGYRTNQFSLLIQAEKCRVFYSVNKCFEIRSDPHNFCETDFENLDAMFVSILLLDLECDFGVEFESWCCHTIF